MSKERQRRRAALEAERAKAGAKAARRTEPRVKVAGATPAGKRPASKRQPTYRQRRFAPLPVRLKVALGLFWLTAAALILYLAPTWTGRFGLLVVLTMTIPLIVVIVRNPSRRYR